MRGTPERWRALPRPTRWVAIVWVIGFVEGTVAHIDYWVVGGVHYFHGQPVLIQVVFQALVVFDPLAAALVVRCHRAAPVVGVAVMAADGVANWWILAGDVVRRPLDFLVPYGLLPITLFALFVFGTARRLRRAFTASPA